MSVQFDYQGFNILSQWNGALTSSSAASAYSTIASVGSNSVGLSPMLFVNSATSSTLVTDAARSTSDANLIAGIKAAQAQGLKVLLEPAIEGLNGALSYTLDPSNTDAFFASYKTAIVHLASIAQATGVDTFSIGNEMGLLTGSAYRSQWVDIINAVRQVYSGKLTYKSGTDEASSVSFWDKVDTIGVNAYLSLSSSTNPTVADLEKAWTTPPSDSYYFNALNGKSMVDFLQSLSTTYGKKVLITEVGYRSIDGGATDPGQWWRAGTADNTDQTNAYKALFQVMQAHGGSWLAGMELWEYNVSPTDTTTSYSPLGKEAMSVVQQYYSGAGSVTGVAVKGSAVADLIDLGSGNDTINAGLGNDVILGGAGNDTIVAGPGTIGRLPTTTITITGYGNGGTVALLINGQQVGDAVTFKPATDSSGYQTYTFTFTNPAAIRSLDLQMQNPGTGVTALLRSITINGAALATTDVTNAAAPGTFNLYAKTIHLDATNYQDWFLGAQTDNDVIEGGAGNDTIDGGAGLDTAVYQGNAADYSFSRSGAKLIVTDSQAARDGQDTLTNVEYLRFADKTVAVASLLVADQGTGTVTALMAPLVASASLGGSGSSPALALGGASAAGSTVTLMSGSTVLATTQADSTGAYAFALSALAAGSYALSVKASLGTLAAASTDAGTFLVGTSRTIMGLVAAATATPQAIFVTDAANPIAVSVAQLRVLEPALAVSVTADTVAVTDTAANVMAGLDVLGATSALKSITLTGDHVFNVTPQGMATLMANDAALLALITNGYTFGVSSTSPTGATVTKSYDGAGTLVSTTTLTVSGGVTETYVRFPDGSTTDKFVDASGTVTSYLTSNASGKTAAKYAIAGQPYASQLYTYDTAGNQLTLTRYYASGVTYSAQTNNSDGSVTTTLFDTAGRRSSVTTVKGTTTDAVTYDAAGAKLTDTLNTATGKTYTLYGLTGQPYTSATYVSDASGKQLSLTRFYATGVTYSTLVTGSDGAAITTLFDTAGRKTSITTVGTTSTEAVTFDASGAKTTDTVTNASGKTYTMYGITGQPYTSATYVSDASGKQLSLTRYYASGVVYSTQVTTTASASTATRTLLATTASTTTADTVTTTLFDTAGRKTSVTTVAPASTEAVTYDAAGARTTDTVTTTSGKTYTMFGIAGQPYTSATYVYDASGKQLSLTRYYASGVTYSTLVTGSDGTATTTLFDTAGRRTSVTAVGSTSTDAVTYDTAGNKLTDTVTTATGKTYTMFGITGQPWTAATYVYDTAGRQLSLTRFYASGVTYSTLVTASDGTNTTTLFDTAGRRTSVTAVGSTSTDAVTYDTAGNKLTDTVTTATGKTYTMFGITGQPYASATYVYDAAGKQLSLTRFYASGVTYSTLTNASDGTATTTLFDTAGHRTSQTIVKPASSETITYDSTGNGILTDLLVDATGKHYTQNGFTGRAYTSQTTDYNTAGVLQDTIQNNTDGTRSVTFNATGASLALAGAKDKITMAGGNTVTLAATPFQDTIQGFHGGSASGHDTIVLSKSLATDFSKLSISQAGQSTVVTVDARHSLTLTGTTGTLGASNFAFV